MHINSILKSVGLTSILSATISQYATAQTQEVGVDVNLFTYADNREYKADYTEDKTFLGIIGSPSLYVKIDNKHTIFGGIHYQQDMGIHRENKSIVTPIAYYNYKDSNFNFDIGFFPRYERLKNVPRALMADTFMYNRPNIEGLNFQYKKRKYDVQVYIDWISKQSYNYREQFIAGANATYKNGIFFVKEDAIMYHNALTSNTTIDQHIQDNGANLFRIGVDLSHKTVLDSFTIDVGLLSSYDRYRTIYDIRYANGFLTNQSLSYKKFFLTNTFYAGDPQSISNADPFYRRKMYDRLDIGWTPFKTDYLETKFALVFHFHEGKSSNQQMFLLRYNFHKKLTK